MQGFPKELASVCRGGTPCGELEGLAAKTPRRQDCQEIRKSDSLYFLGVLAASLLQIGITKLLQFSAGSYVKTSNLLVCDVASKDAI